MQSNRFFLNPNLKLENTYMTLPSHLFSKLLPNLVPMPKLILFNHTLAHEIGFPINSLEHLINVSNTSSFTLTIG